MVRNVGRIFAIVGIGSGLLWIIICNAKGHQSITVILFALLAVYSIMGDSMDSLRLCYRGSIRLAGSKFMGTCGETCTYICRSVARYVGSISQSDSYIKQNIFREKHNKRDNRRNYLFSRVVL